MAVGDLYELVAVTQMGEQAGLIVRHYRLSVAGVPEPSAGGIAAAWSGHISLQLRACMSTQADFRGACARRVRPLPAGAQVCAVTFPGFGTVAGDPLPKQVAGLLKLSTALGGRRNRGRSFVPFPGEVDNASTTLPTLDYLGRLAILAGVLTDTFDAIVGLSATTFFPVIYHRALGTSTDISGFVVRPAWATQRRRGTLGAANVPAL